MFLNFSMQLMIEKKTDKCCYNLFTTLKMTTFIANKCKKSNCKNIVFAFKKNDELLINLKSIFHTHDIYIFLHYIFIFS